MHMELRGNMSNKDSVYRFMDLGVTERKLAFVVTWMNPQE